MTTSPGKEHGSSPAVKPRKPAPSPSWPRPPVAEAAPRRRRPKLSHVLFACLLLSGIIPLAISTFVQGMGNSSRVMERVSTENAKQAGDLALPINAHVEATIVLLHTLGEAVFSLGATEQLATGERATAISDLVQSARRRSPELSVLMLLDSNCVGRGASSSQGEELVLSEPIKKLCQAGIHSTTLTILDAADPSEARLLMAEPIFSRPDVGGMSRLALLVVGTTPVASLSALVAQYAGDDAVRLVLDSKGAVLWWNHPGREASDLEYREAVKEAVRRIPEFSDSRTQPTFIKPPAPVVVEGETLQFETLASKILIGASSSSVWFVVARRPASAAAVDRLFFNTVLSSALLVLLSSLFAASVARWLGRPLDDLATTTREVAAGNFSYRVDAQGLTLEMVDVAENFNRMSEHVERYVRQLREAATANRELFIGSIRAFAAAIDAKDPYTRGHSERVAAVSRAVAKHLGYDEEFQQRVWLGALLHDVGKIGVDDRILKKGGLLSPPEFEQMKLHTVIGAEIMGRIDSLKEIIPAIRWHHEAWNGKGYPDGLKGEQIPLIARIVAVADTFDAVTTSRPYQQAYTPEFAVATITRLASTRFDAKVVTAFLSAFNAGQIESAVQRTPSRSEDAEVSIELLA